MVGGKVVLALVRGDHRLHELKTQSALGEPFRPAQPEEIRATFGADPGSIGPVGPTFASSPTSRCATASSSAARTAPGWHLRGVEAGRDFQAEFADLREVAEGDACAVCGNGTLSIEPAIEVGHIFKLGTRYSVPLNATYLDEAGKEHPIEMGSYGIGPARVVGGGGRAAPRREGDRVAGQPGAVPRAHGRDRGRRRPAVRGRARDPGGARARRPDRALRRPAASPGSRFADAELIGMPARVTVGKRTATEGTADVQMRRGREQVRWRWQRWRGRARRGRRRLSVRAAAAVQDQRLERLAEPGREVRALELDRTSG